jgi:PAS domain S-box-containing protein
MAAVIPVLLALLLALTWQSGRQRAARVDAVLREQLLREAESIAGVINPDLARKLTFTPADRGTPAYEHIREQMVRAGKTFTQRGIYSMALRDGKIYFGPENYAPGDPMASPPGTLYQQPSENCLRCVEDGCPSALGPVTDEYGTFVSALAPVTDPRDGRVIMTVGVDILADDWKASLNKARIKPYGCTLFLLLILGGCTLAIRRRNRTFNMDSMKVTPWILRPISLCLVGCLLLLWSYQYWQYREEMKRAFNRITEQIKGNWNRTLNAKVQVLKAQTDRISADPAIGKAWMEKDRPLLTAVSISVYEQMRRDQGLTHLSFTTLERAVFLRVHRPDQYGDTIERGTMLTAERTGEDSWGVEMGALGMFTLRYVRPWKQDGRVIGYLDLGMEVDQLAGELARDLRVDFLTVILKKSTTREAFEAGRQAFAFTGEWETYPDFVVAKQTLPVIPKAISHWLAKHYPGKSGLPTDVQQGGKQYLCGLVRLSDATGCEVADLIVIQDVTTATGVARSDLWLGMVLTFMLFGGVLSLVWGVIVSADRQVGLAFEKVQKSESLYHTLFNTMAEGVILIAPDGRIVQANAAAERLLGLSRSEIESRKIFGPQWAAFRLDGRTPMPPEERASYRAMKEKRVVMNTEMGVHSPVGSLIWINVNAAPILAPDGNVEGVVATMTDITTRKQAEDAQRLHSEILLNLSEGVYLVRVSDGVILFTNPRFERIFGYDPGELIGKPVSMLNASCGKDPDVLAKEITGAVVRDGRWSGDIRVIRKNGVLFWSRAAVSMFEHSQHGRIMVAVLEDISEQKRMEKEILEVSNAEKQSLGRDLHDGVAQQIAAAGYLCHALNDGRFTPEQKASVKEIEAVLQQSVQQIRNVAHALMPAGLEHAGLVPALQRLIGMLAGTFHVNGRLVQTGAPASLDPQTSTHLYYLIHEAVMNAVRHGRARNIVISLSWNGDFCDSMTVEDDGGGFDPAAVGPDGMGLQIMRHRARHIGGMLEIDSRPGAGTRVTYERMNRHAN